MPFARRAIAITGFGPHEMLAVGDEGLVLVFDGVEWRRTPIGTKNALYAVWGLDARHVLAVGDFGAVLRFNGDRWDEFATGTESFLYGVQPNDPLTLVLTGGLILSIAWVAALVPAHRSTRVDPTIAMRSE